MTTISLFVIFQILNFIVFYQLFDISGGNSNIQTTFSLQIFDFPLYWSHWQTFLLILFLQVTGLLFTMGLILWISSFFKTTISAFATSLGLFFLPVLLKELFKTGVINKLLYLFTINFADPFVILPMLNSDRYLAYTFTLNATIILLFLGVCSVLFSILAYHHIKNWQLQ